MGCFFFISLDYRTQKIGGKVSSDTLATLPLPPSLRTFFTTSTMLWAHLLQKLSS